MSQAQSPGDDEQVDMIRHDDVCEQLRAGLCAGGLKDFSKQR